jgi:hypothetical protein
MTRPAENLRVVVRDAAGAAKKRRQISAFLKKHGFTSLGKGGWLGFRNDDIISGFVMEGSSTDTYISTFILPSYDKHSFITWGLGCRVVHCSLDASTQKECEKAIGEYTTDIFQVRSSAGLVEYLDSHKVTGHYPIWVKYISYLRVSDLTSAENYLDEARRSHLHFVQLEKFEEIKGFVASQDKAGVVEILREWSASSERIFGPFRQTFCAF